MDEPSTGPVGSRRAPALVACGLLVAVALLAISTIPGVRAHPGFDAVYDGWVQGLGYLLCLVLAALGVPDQRDRRPAYAAILAFLALRLAGVVVFNVHVRTLDPRPYPSVADVVLFASGAALFVGLALKVRRWLRQMSPLLVLDAVVAALTVSAVTVAMLYQPLVAASSREVDRAAIVTTLAYPLIDVAVLVLAGALVISARADTVPSDVALFAGVAGLAAAHALYLYQVASGTFELGSFASVLALLSTAVIAGSRVIALRPRPELREQPVGLLIPASMAAICVVVLSLGRTAPLAADLLASGAILVAIVRGLSTLRLDRRWAGAIIAAGEEELVQFKSVVEAATSFVAIARLDGTVIYVNPAGRRMVGLEPDADVRRTTIADYRTEEGLRTARELEQPALARDGHWQGESALQPLDGGPPIPVDVYTFVVRHPQTGEPWLQATAQRDISLKLETQEALRELADQRQRLLTELTEAQEEERARIAADVHDDSVQALAAVELRLLVLQSRLSKLQPDLVAECDELSATVQTATARLRHLLFDLDSPAKRASLRLAIEEAAGYLFGNDLRWQVAGDVDLPEVTRVVAYRIAREALTNVQRHAGASSVLVTMGEESGGLRLDITDDGRGSTEELLASRPGHHGVAGMRRRAAVAGGRLEVRTAVGEGTTVTLWLPYSPVEDAESQSPA